MSSYISHTGGYTPAAVSGTPVYKSHNSYHGISIKWMFGILCVQFKFSVFTTDSVQVFCNSSRVQFYKSVKL